jgi:hypothetical protein
MTDTSFMIKNLETLMQENKDARDQVLSKSELYPFVAHLLEEAGEKNKLYPFAKRLLEENEELVTRLAQAQQSYAEAEREAKRYRLLQLECMKETERLQVKYNALLVENGALATLAKNPSQDKIDREVLKTYAIKGRKKRQQK